MKSLSKEHFMVVTYDGYSSVASVGVNASMHVEYIYIVQNAET